MHRNRRKQDRIGNQFQCWIESNFVTVLFSVVVTRVSCSNVCPASFINQTKGGEWAYRKGGSIENKEREECVHGTCTYTVHIIKCDRYPQVVGLYALCVAKEWWYICIKEYSIQPNTISFFFLFFWGDFVIIKRGPRPWRANYSHPKGYFDDRPNSKQKRKRGVVYSVYAAGYTINRINMK